MPLSARSARRSRYLQLHQEFTQPFIPYELYVVHTERDNADDVGTHFESRVIAGLSQSTVDRLSPDMPLTYHFWRSMARLDRHLGRVDHRAAQLNASEPGQDEHEWSGRAAPILRETLRHAELSRLYHVHQDRASFDTAVAKGMRLYPDYRCGAGDEPVFTIFVVSKTGKSRALSDEMAEAHTVRGAHDVTWITRDIADQVVSAVNSMRYEQELTIPLKEGSESPWESVCRATEVLTSRSLLKNRYTEEDWRTVMRATLEDRPEATVLQATCTAANLAELIERCPSMDRIRWEVHAGECSWDWHKRMMDVVSD